MKKIEFPQDELAHNNIIEWWYFNGHLRDAKGNRYSFMDCLFKIDVKKVNIPFLNKMPFKTLYFSHSLLSDIEANKFYPKVDYVSLISKDSFSKSLLLINYRDPLVLKDYTNRVIEKTNESRYRIKTDNFDLAMTSVKKPLLEGGTGYISLKNEGTYYYSLTNLKTKGTIKINDMDIEVEGKSWMDHQWADVVYNPKTKWTWFSIQLDNNIEIVCFEYDNEKEKTYLATLSYKNDKQASANDVILTPTDIIWQSPMTKAKYPLSWKINIPSLKISLKVEPLLKEQEMLFGTINYWEGPLTVSGVIKKKNVKGVGFMELVGYPMGISNLNFYKKSIEEAIRKSLWPAIKKKGEQFVSHIWPINIIKDHIKTNNIEKGKKRDSNKRN